jgi:hypothetical protein
MQGELATFARIGSSLRDASGGGISVTVPYDEALELLLALLKVPDLDRNLQAQRVLVYDFERALERALVAAYAAETGAQDAHLFLQRVLYHINRLKLFWYDDLRHYVNERSNYLRAIRDRIEDEWQRWELGQLDQERLRGSEVGAALRERAAADLDPAPSQDQKFFSEQVGLRGYRRLLEIASLDGLVEASQLSRTLGGVGNEIHSMLTRLLVEEYGGGRLARKHSSYFTAMLSALGLRTETEAYFAVVPWEVLATINHSFLLSERKRYFLRYIGGLLYTEVSVPAAFHHYHRAAERLGLTSEAMGYWDLHIKEDERHGRWMLHDVALPLAARYGADAWELVLGYDQQRLMSNRAGSATARAAREAEQESQQSQPTQPQPQPTVRRSLEAVG